MNPFDPREPVSTWTHVAGLALALLATLILWRRSRGDRARRACLVVFGASLAACYAASALYHGVRGPGEMINLLARIDLVGIYGLIAGTYTPIAWALLQGRWRWGTLATAWVVVAVAATLIAVGVIVPPAISTGLFLAAGWGGVVCAAELMRVVSPRDLLAIVVGGLLYSVGAAINLMGWPAPWPGVFGAHEIFHLFVIAGSAAHFWFIFRYVASPPAFPPAS